MEKNEETFVRKTLNWWEKYYFYERTNSRSISIILILLTHKHSKNSNHCINSYLELNRWIDGTTLENSRREEKKKDRKEWRRMEKLLLEKLNFELRKILFLWKNQFSCDIILISLTRQHSKNSLHFSSTLTAIWN